MGTDALLIFAMVHMKHKRLALVFSVILVYNRKAEMLHPNLTSFTSQTRITDIGVLLLSLCYLTDTFINAT